jgi:lipopolysaccharide transport system ATP-binding protein
MALLALEHVSVDFPVLGAHAISLKRTLVSAATGGRLGVKAGVTIVHALHDICFELHDGDRLGLLGHNGAGKSTLLRVLSGVYAPTSGILRREGRVASLIDPTLGIEPEATGLENIVLRGLLMGVGRRDLMDARRTIGEFSGLGDYLAMPVRTYSSGMVMRLAFAIVTHFPADIVVMDEWLSVGDAAFQSQAEVRLRDLVGRSGILVLASHSEPLIERECDRRIRLEHGAITADERIPGTTLTPAEASA